MAQVIDRKAMSYQDWKDLGPLYHKAESEQDFYDGTRRAAPTTPNWASLYVGAKHDLGNPNHNYKADPFTNGHSHFMHFMKMLSEPNKKSLKLIRAAAKEGDKVTQISRSKHGNDDAWVMLGADEGSAEVVRGFIKIVLEKFPPSKTLTSQVLPKTVEDVPFEEIRKEMASIRPRLFRKRVMENGSVRFLAPANNAEQELDQKYGGANKSSSNYKPRQFAGVIAVFADDGMQNQAAEYIRGLDQRLLAAPEKNGPIWSALRDNRPSGAFYPQMYQANAKQREAGEQLIERADGVVCFLDGDPMSRVHQIVADASRAGKLVKVIDPSGAELDVIEAGKEAEALHMSKKEFARSMSDFAFDIMPNSPEGYMALSLLRDEKAGKIDTVDIAQLSQIHETINDIAHDARDEDKAAEMVETYRVSPKALRILGNEDNLARAREMMIARKAEISNWDMQIVGPDDYASALLTSGKAPPFLIVEGDVNALSSDRPIVGITGNIARETKDQRLTSANASKAVLALTEQDATLAYVQGQTSLEIPASRGQIMIAPVGAAHLSDEMRQQQIDVIENGGCVVHLQPPEVAAWKYDAKAYNPETKKKGLKIPVPSTHDASIDARGASLLGSLSDTVLVTSMDARDVHSSQHLSVNSGLSAGRAPTVLNYSRTEFGTLEHISGNRALLSGVGTRALVKAGFSDDVALKNGKPFDADGRKPAIDTGPNPELAMRNLVSHLQGRPIELPKQEQTRKLAVENQM